MYHHLLYEIQITKQTHTPTTRCYTSRCCIVPKAYIILSESPVWAHIIWFGTRRATCVEWKWSTRDRDDRASLCVCMICVWTKWLCVCVCGTFNRCVRSRGRVCVYRVIRRVYTATDRRWKIWFVCAREHSVCLCAREQLRIWTKTRTRPRLRTRRYRRPRRHCAQEAKERANNHNNTMYKVQDRGDQSAKNTIHNTQIFWVGVYVCVLVRFGCKCKFGDMYSLCSSVCSTIQDGAEDVEWKKHMCGVMRLLAYMYVVVVLLNVCRNPLDR